MQVVAVDQLGAMEHTELVVMEEVVMVGIQMDQQEQQTEVEVEVAVQVDLVGQVV
jgi:hypothetical protein